MNQKHVIPATGSDYRLWIILMLVKLTCAPGHKLIIRHLYDVFVTHITVVHLGCQRFTDSRPVLFCILAKMYCSSLSLHSPLYFFFF